MNLSDIRILELGDEYILQLASDNASRGKGQRFYGRNVAYLPVGNSNDYVVLTIHISGKLAMFRSVDQQWKIIGDMRSYYDDVICFDGGFYAVDSTGRTVTVSADSGDLVAVVEGPVSDGRRKRLVPMGKKLILVDVYDIPPPTDSEEVVEQEDGRRDVDFDKYILQNSNWLRVFKLDRDSSKWAEIDYLGDQVLFLARNCAFSASASDLKWYDSKGNYIFCNKIDYRFPWVFVEGYEAEYENFEVFDMKTRRVCYDDHPYYSKLFWPVPSWFTSNT